MSELPPSILIIEDEEGLRRSLRVFFEDDGFEVIVAASGEEALRFMIECRPDTAIVDLGLPGIDGNTFIEEARKLHSGIRFIVYTGSVSYKPSLRLNSLGITEENVFKKPLTDMSILVEAVRKQLASGGGDDPKD
jgi:two-component system, OmpR family, response regulator